MTIRRRRRTGRDGAISWDDLSRAQRNGFGYFNLRRDWSAFGSWEEAERQYWRHRALIAEDFKRYPCRRPPCWWEFEAPKLLKQDVDVEAGEHLLEFEVRYLALLRREQIQGAANRIGFQRESNDLPPSKLTARWLGILGKELQELDAEWGFSEAERSRVRGGGVPHDIQEKATLPLPWTEAGGTWEALG